jgi:ATP-binding cassette subfamily B multidrug efflux pump
VKQLAKYFLPYLWPMVGLLALVYGQTWSTLALPDYLANIIDKGVEAQNTHYIYTTGLMMLLVALAGGVCMIGVGYVATRIATGFATDVRAAVFTKVEGFSLHEFNHFSSASLITRSTNDVQQIQQVLNMVLRISFMAPFMGVGAILKAYHLAPSMTWIMVVAIIIILVSVLTIFSIALPKFKHVQKLVDRLNLVTREFLTGIRVIRAFNQERHEERKFDTVNLDITKTNIFVNRLLAALQPTMMFMMNIVSVAIVWIGASEVSSGAIQIGSVLAFVQYAIQAIAAFLMLSIIFVFAPRAIVSADRLGEVLATDPTIIDPKAAKVPDVSQRGKVTFDDVSFAYAGADKPVLEHVSFTALPGQTTAFVGSTGSGKSTLVNLIPRFYDTTAGTVAVDGVDVRQLKLQQLHSLIGYVPQRSTLFTGSIKSNIAYGNHNVSAEALDQAAEIAQAKDFIDELDNGYESSVAQGGTNLSGGQKQRLSIARAIAYNPEIYIFDDSFSALDFATDAKLRAELAQKTKDKTVLIVAQRIGTILHADNIIVLEEGRVVGQGTHSQLLKTCKVYQEIAESQLSEDELRTVGAAA